MFFKLNIISEETLNNFIINFIKDNGIIFIKLGQIISSVSGTKTRSILGEKLFYKLRTLTDKCNQELVTNNDNNYDYINKNPIASGSIAQVYKIKYKDKICAYKRLIPNVNLNINKSIDNLIFYKNVLFKTNKKIYDLINIVELDEYIEYIKKQTNFHSEKKNIKKFREIFKDIDKIIIPEVYYCDRSNLIMSFEEGVTIFEIKKTIINIITKLFILCLLFH